MNIVTNHKVIIGDSRKMLKINNNTVDLIVTSPPYWQLKDYNNENQIGYNDTYEEYINNLNVVWKECYRILNNDCKLCINVGDQYARSIYYGRYKVIPIRTEIIKFCESIGFDYMGAIIWQKVATMNTTGGASVMGSFPFPKNGILKLDYEFILIFKKIGKSDKIINKELKEMSIMTKEEWNTYFSGHWNFSGAKQDEHIAMFPDELPKRLIKMFSFVNDIIFDPFLGSGTTSLSAINLNRNSIGYEINKDFLPIIKKKLGVDKSQLIKTQNITIEEQEILNIDYKTELEGFPYIFKDYIKIDKKIDPKLNQFGSIIEKDKKIINEYFSVKKILSPILLELNTGLTIKLLGIKELEHKRDDAVSFLELMFKNQKVFLKFDEIKYDENNNLLCYVYLKNKTFINFHLLKNKFVETDSDSSFKYKEKFLKSEE